MSARPHDSINRSRPVIAAFPPPTQRHDVKISHSVSTAQVKTSDLRIETLESTELTPLCCQDKPTFRIDISTCRCSPAATPALVVERPRHIVARARAMPKRATRTALVDVVVFMATRVDVPPVDAHDD